MDACASITRKDDRTRVLLVDTDNLFSDDLGGALQADAGLDLVATARSIEDAYACAERHMPDVILIGWGKASRSFVHAALANQSSARTNPLIVIVLSQGITSIPGLTSLSLLPNVALMGQTQVAKCLLRTKASTPAMLH